MSTSGNLVQAARELLHEWQQTKSHWQDVKSQEFEQTYIEPLPGHADRASKMMAEIDLLLKKIRSDCE